MIVRTCFECSTCGQKHIFRVQVGQSNYQKHEVKCHTCYEKIVISFDLDQDAGEIAINSLENCQPAILNNPSDGLLLPTEYLSDDFQVSESDRKAQMSFPALKLMQAMRQQVEDKKLVAYPKKVSTHILDQWKIVKKSWSLTRSNQHELAKKEFEKYNKICDIGELDLESALYAFTREYISLNPHIQENFAESIGWLRSIDDKKIKDLSVYFNTVNDEHMRRYYETFNSFFENYSEFSQVQFSHFLPNNFVATSNSFESVRMFYGNCFEHLGSNLDIIACLNNIQNGRNYDQFERMNLKQYNSLDKANKLGPLRNTPEIFDIFKSFDNKLRNASHHGHMICENNIVKFKLNQNKDYDEITYTNYLIKCKSIFDSMCLVLMLELFFKRVICEKSKTPRKSTLGNAIRRSMHKM